MNDSKSQFRWSIIYLFARLSFSVALRVRGSSFKTQRRAIHVRGWAGESEAAEERDTAVFVVVNILILCSGSGLPFIERLHIHFFFLSFFHWFEVVCDPFLLFEFLSAIVYWMSQMEEWEEQNLSTLWRWHSHGRSHTCAKHTDAEKDLRTRAFDSRSMSVY